MALPKERIGISLTELLKATMAGGLLFLLPVALIAIVLKQAMQLVGKIVRPISNYLPIEAVVGVWGETLLAAVVLILVSLVAGLVARTKVGTRIIRWFENSLLGGLPQYQLVKSMRIRHCPLSVRNGRHRSRKASPLRVKGLDPRWCSIPGMIRLKNI